MENKNINSNQKPRFNRGQGVIRTFVPPPNPNRPQQSSPASGPRRRKPRYRDGDRMRPHTRRLAPVERHEKETSADSDSLKIIPLGGLGEVGRNMCVLEYKDDIIVIDAGFGFPEDDQPGIDFNLPNINYLEEKKDKIRAILVTHGHYDHIGAFPYIMPRLGNPPVYSGNIAVGIIMKRHLEFPHLPELDITIVHDKDTLQFGNFKVEFFHINHNIPDTFGLIIETPAGKIVHTADFKFDPTPLNEAPTDLEYIKSIGNRGVTMLMSDSTGAEKEGTSISETTIQDNLEVIFKESQGRIITATFSSLLNRIQQLITLSEKYNRKVVFDGFSLKSNVEYAKEVNQLHIKKGTEIKIDQIDDYPDGQITIIGTGAQGEERSVLMRIASGEHRFVKLRKSDSIVFSSSVVPGNERTVQRLKDLFYRMRCHVYHYGMMDIHSGGHAMKEDLKKMIRLINPKFFMPIHGYYSMMVTHGYLAEEEGVPEKNVVIADNGNIIHITPNEWWYDTKSVQVDNIMVDGLGVGDVGSVVMRDRQVLAEDGFVVIVALIDTKTLTVRGSPDIISRGFVYLKEQKDLLTNVRKKIRFLIHKHATHPINWADLKDAIRNEVGLFLFQKTERRPMILPVVIEV